MFLVIPKIGGGPTLRLGTSWQNELGQYYFLFNQGKKEIPVKIMQHSCNLKCQKWELGPLRRSVACILRWLAFRHTVDFLELMIYGCESKKIVKIKSIKWKLNLSRFRAIQQGGWIYALSGSRRSGANPKTGFKRK